LNARKLREFAEIDGVLIDQAEAVAVSKEFSVHVWMPHLLIQ